MTGPLDVLVVEDSEAAAFLLRTQLTQAGYAVGVAPTAAEALRRHAADRPPIVLLDLSLPDGDGMDVLATMRGRDPAMQAIVITADGSINRAVAAMRAGASDFLVKPVDGGRLVKTVAAATKTLADRGPPPAQGVDGFEGFVGAAPAMQAVYETLEQVARSMATVFITGESGTGKEVCAQALHRRSPRRDGPFIALNCGAIPSELLESEVFGHVKGSFTGAIADKPGAARAADGGTLFLDEICEMDMALQTKLLRFLQTSAVQPVGAAAPKPVDVRIVCATNRDPAAEVAAGRFRADLFYRLHVVPVELPPLRARGEDVTLIARSLLRRYAVEEGRAFRDFAEETLAALRRYPWPGNVRELQNVIRYVVVLHDGPLVLPEMLRPEVLAPAAGLAAPTGYAPPPSRAPALSPSAPETAVGAAPSPAPDAETLRRAAQALVGAPLAVVEREVIDATIAACGGSVPRAAQLLDVSPSTLYRKRQAWGARRDADG